MNAIDLTKTLAEILLSRNWTVSLAESCTGGLVCATLTELAGSSVWFERGYITYSNEAKTECLDVSAQQIESHGAVSEQVAKAMAEGARINSGSNVAISITGIAGPGGSSPEKPVGTVCFGWATENQTLTKTMCFDGDRQAVRLQATEFALTELIALLRS
ncbi:CinA family protein [Polynucleobacter sp. AP-Reno-20A-A9]|jgi:nicotinamide-nucleotide amidase|uniref:CinA family protein n=1 Tax=Polynucleobacter sp. AP-Reno-20A-A9 TaxID=2576925 RepID=UPI001C0D5AB8|nr:CinA family protein [Polynucleobacter sp. AP-Reno-20A-A9]MBU3627550.1 CinA family protein [Polynucleobacter sp. AP-Reno-20A-A9]